MTKWIRLYVAGVLLLINLLPPCAVSASVATKLSFFRYAISSETTDDWTTLVSVERGSTSQLLGLFTLKAKPNSKLMAIRRDTSGDKVCSFEKNAMNLKGSKYETIKAPKGWSCILVDPAKDRVIAVKSFFVKGRSRSTPFSMVLIGESLSRERFMNAVVGVKDVP